VETSTHLEPGAEAVFAHELTDCLADLFAPLGPLLVTCWLLFATDMGVHAPLVHEPGVFSVAGSLCMVTSLSATDRLL